MKLDGLRRSSNIEDRRGGGGRGGKVALSGGAIVVLIIVGAIMGRDPGEIASDVIQAERRAQRQQPSSSAPSTTSGGRGARDPAEERAKDFVSKVLATTEDAWRESMPKLNGRKYEEPRLVLFGDSVDSACGYQTAAVGPFYCGRDRKAYLDLTFFAALSKKFGAPGDFAQAYVVAHEVGHHVQNLAGISAQVARGGKQRGADSEAVRQELQADCFAGVWGAYAKRKGLLEIGDVDEAIKAAQAIGDDTLQKRGRGRVSPETFSHGTSAQRARWFKRGLDSGDPKQCDTFSAKTL